MLAAWFEARRWRGEHLTMRGVEFARPADNCEAPGPLVAPHGEVLGCKAAEPRTTHQVSVPADQT